MSKILLAGATGYLGSYILSELLHRGIDTRIIVQNESKLDESQKGKNSLEIRTAQVTEPESLTGCCDDVATLISTIGITKLKDELSYMDVDNQANVNLLYEAKRSGVKKMIYISVLNGEKLKHLAICKAK